MALPAALPAPGRRWAAYRVLDPRSSRAIPLIERRPTIEGCRHRLDVGALVRDARLSQPGLWCGWAATGAATLFPPVMVGQTSASLLLSGSRGRLWLTWSDDGLGDQEAALAFTGFWRWLAICPVLGQRVANLYRPAGAALFASVTAHDLRYAVVGESRAERAVRRVLRMRRALGEAAPVLGGPLPPPPPLMRARAYLAACDAIRAAEDEACSRNKCHTVATLLTH